METSPEINEIAKALAAAQGSLRPARKDSVNPHYKSRYADLATILDTVRFPLQQNGLSIIQTPSVEGTSVEVTTMLLHESGQYIRCTLKLEAADTRPQSIGSAVTYGRRYGLVSMLAVSAAEDDDDGAAASARAEEPKPARARKEPRNDPFTLMLASIAELKERMEPETYYRILQELGGFSHANEIRKIETGRELYKRLMMAIAAQPAARVSSGEVVTK